MSVSPLVGHRQSDSSFDDIPCLIQTSSPSSGKQMPRLLEADQPDPPLEPERAQDMITWGHVF